MAEVPDLLPDWMRNHVRTYLATDGADGHMFDFAAIGGKGVVPTLLLKTIGRRSKRAMLIPLIYGKSGEEFVVIASKGGSEKHPAWYLNLTAEPQIDFQVKDKRYRGTWRIATGEERARIWNEMVELFPPYAQYQANTAREIPVVLIKPVEAIASL